MAITGLQNQVDRRKNGSTNTGTSSGSPTQQGIVRYKTSSTTVALKNYLSPTWTDLPFDSVEFDSDSEAFSNWCKIKTAGKRRIVVSVLGDMKNGFNNTCAYCLRILKNGTEIAMADQRNYHFANEPEGAKLVFTDHFNVNDEIKVQACGGISVAPDILAESSFSCMVVEAD